MSTARVPSLPRNRSHSTWRWASASCSGPSAAAAPAWARLSAAMLRWSASVWEHRPSCSQTPTPSLRRSQALTHRPLALMTVLGLGCLRDAGRRWEFPSDDVTFPGVFPLLHPHLPPLSQAADHLTSQMECLCIYIYIYPRDLFQVSDFKCQMT